MPAMTTKNLLTCWMLLCTLGCSTPTKYPSHWWASVDQSAAKSWEILPQEANQGEVILSKRNELGLLSNFAHTPFEFEGKKYQSMEGFWQMMKYPEGKKDKRNLPGVKWPYTREEVAQMVAFKAKKAGDFGSQIMRKRGIDWVTYKGQKMKYREKGESGFYKLIRKAMFAKVEHNPKVKKILLATKGLKLRPDHKQSSSAPKAWRYYEIYMEIRDKDLSNH